MPYHGPLRAVILDWAGTTVDFGCQAPVVVLTSLFASHGIELTAAEARREMGLLKKDQIRAILAGTRMRTEWNMRKGAPSSEADVESLFDEFQPRQLDCLAQYSTLIPGVAEAVHRMRQRKLRIGTTTGYTRPMLNILLSQAEAQGYAPDSSVTPDEVGAGRPYPWMAWQNAIQLRVYPLEACVKIGDTTSDIQEGRNAGMWTIGLSATGNEIGLTEQAFNGLTPEDRNTRLEAARQRLSHAGAHYVADSLAHCDEILDEIEHRLEYGERP